MSKTSHTFLVHVQIGTTTLENSLALSYKSEHSQGLCPGNSTPGKALVYICEVRCSGTTNKMKRQPVQWQKIFANHVSDKGLISKIYEELTRDAHKELMQYQKTKQLNLETVMRSEQTFIQRRHPDGQQASEKMVSIINHQGNANRNHNEISSHLLEWLLSKRQDITNC